MRTLDRYIIKNFLSSALSVLLALMMLRILMDMFFNMDEFAEHGGFADVVRGILAYYGYHSFEYFTQLGGVIIVLAAVFAIWRMNHTNELTAMLASGISLHRVVWPIVFCSMLMGGVIILDQELILPRIAPKLILQRDGSDERSGRAFGVAAATDRFRTVWNSPRFDGDDERMLRPIYLVRDRKQLVLLAQGDSMDWGWPVGPENTGEAGWVLTMAMLSRMTPGGVAYNINPTSEAIHTSVGGPEMIAAVRRAWLAAGVDAPAEGEYNYVNSPPMVTDPSYDMEILAERLKFHPADPRAERTYTLIRPRFSFFADTETDGRRLLGVFMAESAEWVDTGEATYSHWRLTGGVLFMPSDLTANDLLMQQSDKWMVYMSSAQLARLLASGKATDPDSVKMTRNIRIADPVNNLVMLLLGLPFILSRERNLKASALLCLIMVGAFFAFTYICRYMGLGPFWAAFLPIPLFGPVAVVMLDAVKT